VLKKLHYLAAAMVLLSLLLFSFGPPAVVSAADRPTFTGVDPTSALQGATVSVTILPTEGWGDNYELQDSTLGVNCVDLGPGITLLGYGTHYAPGACLKISIRIDAGAAPGLRNCVLHAQNASGSDKFDLTLPNAFTVNPAGPVPTKVQVETAANGSGTVVPAQNILTGSAITVYAITRDASDVFIANVAADAWSLQSITGGVVAGDLVPSGDSKSAVFTGHAAGTAQIQATSGILATTNSGTLTVTTIPPPPPPPTTSTITATTGTGGSITPSGAVIVNNGANQTFTITPNGGWLVAYVLVDGSSVGRASTYTFTNVTTNHTINASFIPQQPGIGSSGGGSSSSSGGPAAQSPVSLANIQVQSATLSATKVGPGQAVTVTANVANTGTGKGTTAVKLYVNGLEESSKGVAVSSGSSTPVSFSVSRNEPGAYTVYVGGVSAGSFTVEQFTDGNIILYVSGALVLIAIVGAIVYFARRRTVS